MRAIVGVLVMVAGCALPGGEDEHLPWSGPAPTPTVDVSTVSSSSSAGSTSAAATSSATGAGGEGGGAGGQGGEGGNAATTASSTSAGGEGGQGGAPGPECVAAEDCPGEDRPCSWPTCNDGACSRALAFVGTPVPDAEPGDCRRHACDGAGNATPRFDAADVPDDGNECTNEVCSIEGPKQVLVATGTPCATGLCQDGACVDYIPVRCKVPDPSVDYTIFMDCDGFGSRSTWIRWMQPDGSETGCVSAGPGYCAPGSACTVWHSNLTRDYGVCL
ncbi:hypothetical protein [Sorangium sp. So ce362]|uniref:hypothetical protein n=1 Tax=Sorangium sp. So ce362 TaxID=3133303 RepID=UPI003F5EEC64